MKRLAALQRKTLWIGLLGILALIGLVTSFAPLERTLGERARHGAWVWTGKLAFAAAGFVGLLLPGPRLARLIWQRASVALGWAGGLLADLFAPFAAGSADELGWDFLG
jgi:hypothetical protein